MKHLILFESLSGRMVGDYFLSNTEYDNYIGDGIYGIDEEDFQQYLDILNTYYHHGGSIQRVLFSSSVNEQNLGHHWTHMDNDIENYIDLLYDFLRDEGRIERNPSITVISGVTPPHNISIKYALEQYQTNYWEEEIYIINPSLITEFHINQIR
jgi:hypothetical protein